jgi:hypothetical protein
MVERLRTSWGTNGTSSRSTLAVEEVVDALWLEVDAEFTAGGIRIDRRSHDATRSAHAPQHAEQFRAGRQMRGEDQQQMFSERRPS